MPGSPLDGLKQSLTRLDSILNFCIHRDLRPLRLGNYKWVGIEAVRLLIWYKCVNLLGQQSNLWQRN